MRKTGVNLRKFFRKVKEESDLIYKTNRADELERLNNTERSFMTFVDVATQINASDQNTNSGVCCFYFVFLTPCVPSYI